MKVKILLFLVALIFLACPVSAATASWTSSQGENSEYLTVIFIGGISGANASAASQWQWNFGDGCTGTGQTTAHTYAAPSSSDDLIWTVNLMVTTDAVDDSEVISVSERDITLAEPDLDAIFTVSPASGEGDAPLTATFTDATFGRHSIVSWDFGDGTIQPTPSPVTHKFDTPGTYTVILTVDRDGTQDSWSHDVKALDPTPVPFFHTNVISGKCPLFVQFTDDSLIAYGNIMEWLWDFGDGYTSTAQNPVHTYNEVGSYDVKLTVTSDKRKFDSVTDTKCIVVEATPIPPSGTQYSNGNLTIKSGWNFISTPKRLDALNGNNTAGKIFESVDSGGHSALMYNGSNCQWDAVRADSIIKPLDALWIYSNSTEDTTIHLTFDSNPLQVPPSKYLSAGWNTLGHSSVKSATAKDSLIDVSDKWTKVIGWDATEQKFENIIISGGSGIYSDLRALLPGKGYWVWMKEEGTVASLAIN